MIRLLAYFILIIQPRWTVAADIPISIKCDGTYRNHLQGVTRDSKNAIFWSFTDTLVKTDLQGKVIRKITVRNHHGDLCFHGGMIYVAVNFGRFNDPKMRADSWVYVYNSDDLSLLSKHKTPELVYGAGGIASHKGSFFVVGGLPETINENYVYEYDKDFKYVKRHTLDSGHTHLGIQTAEYADGNWWFGCYGNPNVLLKANQDFSKVEKFNFSCSLGIVRIDTRKFLIASGSCTKGKGCVGKLQIGQGDDKHGIVLLRK